MDQCGIYDISQNRFVLSLRNPEDGLKSARAAFQEEQVTTARENSTNQALTYEIIFKLNGTEIFRLEIDQSDRRRGAKITKLAEP